MLHYRFTHQYFIDHPELINLWVVAAVIRRGDRILAAKRLEGGPSEWPSHSKGLKF